jgi:hypothetical protein
VYGALGTRTVAMSALGYQHNSQWDTHNLYGLSEGIVTARAVANITGQRPFVLSRHAPPHGGCCASVHDILTYTVHETKKNVLECC